MDEADLPLAGIVREHGGGLMDFHRMKGIERLTGSSDWDFYSWTVENYDDDLLDVCERENAADVLAEEGLQPRRNHVIIMDEMHRALRASPLMVEKLDLLTRLNRQWGVGQIMITHTFKDLMCMETPAQNTKARRLRGTQRDQGAGRFEPHRGGPLPARRMRTARIPAARRTCWEDWAHARQLRLRRLAQRVWAVS